MRLFTYLDKRNHVRPRQTWWCDACNQWHRHRLGPRPDYARKAGTCRPFKDRFNGIKQVELVCVGPIPHGVDVDPSDARGRMMFTPPSFDINAEAWGKR